MDKPEYRRFAPSRRIVVDAGFLGTGRHVIYGLLSLDVTDARHLLRELGGERPLSFTAFLVASLGRAIAAQPEIQAVLDWRGRLAVFRSVDVVTMIEPEAGAVAVPHIVRDAANRSVAEISAEIRHIQDRPAHSEQDQSRGWAQLAPYLPRRLRLSFFRLLKRLPTRFQQTAGTTILSSVGMFGRRGGWGISFLPLHTCGVTVGGIVPEPGVVDGEIAIREVVHVTLAFDHDIVDGAPAARFAARFAELVESCAVLQRANAD